MRCFHVSSMFTFRHHEELPISDEDSNEPFITCGQGVIPMAASLYVPVFHRVIEIVKGPKKAPRITALLCPIYMQLVGVEPSCRICGIWNAQCSIPSNIHQQFTQNLTKSYPQVNGQCSKLFNPVLLCSDRLPSRMLVCLALLQEGIFLRGRYVKLSRRRGAKSRSRRPATGVFQERFSDLKKDPTGVPIYGIVHSQPLLVSRAKKRSRPYPQTKRTQQPRLAC